MAAQVEPDGEEPRFEIISFRGPAPESVMGFRVSCVFAERKGARAQVFLFASTVSHFRATLTSAFHKRLPARSAELAA